MTSRAVVLLAVLCGAAVGACGKQRTDAGDSWAVGTYIGGGSSLFGSGTCTHDAPPAVAELPGQVRNHSPAAAAVALGSWYHVATVYDGTAALATRLRVYVNGRSTHRSRTRSEPSPSPARIS